MLGNEPSCRVFYDKRRLPHATLLSDSGKPQDRLWRKFRELRGWGEPKFEIFSKIINRVYTAHSFVTVLIMAWMSISASVIAPWWTTRRKSMQFISRLNNGITQATSITKDFAFIIDPEVTQDLIIWIRYLNGLYRPCERLLFNF